MRVSALLFVLATASLSCAQISAQRGMSCQLGLNAQHADLPIPLLTPPPGATVVTRSGGGNATTFDCNLRVDTAPVESLIANNSSQMTALGWKLIASYPDSALTVQHFRGATAAGDELTAVAIVTPLSGTTAVDVSLHIVRHGVSGSGAPTAPASIGRTGGAGASANADPESTLTMLRRLMTSRPVAATPGEPWIQQDSPPPWFPPELLPAETDVRLSATSTTQITVVALARSLTVFHVPGLLAKMNGAGWAVRNRRSGFLPVAAMTVPYELCRGQDTALVEYMTFEGSGGLAIRVAYQRDSKVGCQGGSRPTSFADVPMPVLLMPAGATATSSSGRGSMDTSDSQTTAQTSASAGTLAKEFSNQLAQGGWTIRKQSGSEAGPTAICAAHATAAGDPVTALVVVTTIPGAARADLWLHVVRHKLVSQR